MTGADGVAATRPALRRGDGGSTPTSALQPALYGPKDIVIKPVTPRAARSICEKRHYLGSYPGGSLLNFGIFVGNQLLGVAVLGVGPANAHRFFQDAKRAEVVCLSRLWLSDLLGRNCESRTLAVILRSLRRHQSAVKAVVAYSDPLAGHSGGIYRAAGFLYVGPSGAMPLYRTPDGAVHHSRSLSHSYGTHNRRHFKEYGVEIELVAQVPKHTYIALVDPAWRARLTLPILPYPNSSKEEDSHAPVV